MQKTGAQIIAECLLEQGVDTVFGYPGGAVLYIYDALYEYSDRIRHILTCHEQGAAHAADGYARSTGKTGVVIATSGPGATNLVTGIATAHLDSSPLVAITGNVATPLLGRDSFQEVDISGITMPIVKHNFVVNDVEQLAGTLRLAFKIAKEGRPGPVLVDIPKDVSAALTEYERETPQNPADKLAVQDKDLDSVVKSLTSSERPFIFAGGGICIADACAELKEFAERLDAPVAASLMGLGCFSQSDRRFTGMIGMHGTKASGLAASKCDLLIALGTRFSDRVTCNASRFARQAKILHIDIDPAEINKNVQADYSVTGDLKLVLQALNNKIPQMKHDEWMSQVNGWKLHTAEVATEGVTPQKVIETLYSLTNGEAIITTEVGQHQIWTAQYYKFAKPRQFVTSGGLGTMGFGLGAAIGSKIGNPDKTVVNIAGDGSFHMNFNELATVVRYNIPIVEIVMNNNVLGMVRQWQKLFYGSRYSHTTLDRPTDYKKLAEALGAVGFEINTADDIEPVLKKALELKQPCLVNCCLSMDENVLPMVPAGAPIEEPLMKMQRGE